MILNFILLFFFPVFFCFRYCSNFVQTLASFKKPLVTFVQGNVCGLGNRILPLFDVVYAHKNTLLVNKNDKFGDILEGSAIISATDKISYNAVSLVRAALNVMLF